MPQPPKELNPTGSVRERFGAHLRHWRMVRRLTQTRLGHLVHVSGNQIGKIEKGERLCRKPLARLLYAALDTGGILEWMCPYAEAEADNERHDAYKTKGRTGAGRTGVPEAVMLSLDDETLRDNWSDVRRRSFLTAGGVSAIAASPFSHLLAPLSPHSFRPWCASRTSSRSRTLQTSSPVGTTPTVGAASSAKSPQRS